ncbi:tRNA-modifying protein YgfZ [Pseudidiomarina sp.]|uniref:tRNA-modifying protein YgfZ n=1 Tax=Pseudidiomarina sp. TaxID=2081707 RepID=UPI00299DC9E1|nr:tRNA-modifying protein YgfZ [Pseudidiomarina sp.]MDX1704886.1 tRNA-modifying protein YgfZ [Pseudidiomarina sp.]
MPAPEFTKAPPEYVTVSLQDYGVIRLSGSQTETFLQGQLTCDMRELSQDNWLFSAHCDNKGKAMSTLFVCRYGDSVLLITALPALRETLAQLQKFGVFSKVEITDASDELHCYGVFGTAAPAHLADFVQQPLNSESDQPVTQTADGVVLKLGSQPDQYLYVTSKDDFPANAEASAWHALEIERGRATLLSGTILEYVPQMLNVQALHGISFKKGCYIGQETIARMKYLGKQKRALFRLRGQGNAVTPGTTVEQQLGDNWRRAGTVINAVSRAEQQLDVLAVLPHDIGEDTQLRIKGDDASLLEIYPLPYNLDES